jgi:hypothetical protein
MAIPSDQRPRLVREDDILAIFEISRAPQGTRATKVRGGRKGVHSDTVKHGRDGQTFADPMGVTDRWLGVEDVDAVRVIRYRLVAAAMDVGVAHHATGAESS